MAILATHGDSDKGSPGSEAVPVWMEELALGTWVQQLIQGPRGGGIGYFVRPTLGPFLPWLPPSEPQHHSFTLSHQIQPEATFFLGRLAKFLLSSPLAT